MFGYQPEDDPLMSVLQVTEEGTFYHLSAIDVYLYASHDEHCQLSAWWHKGRWRGVASLRGFNAMFNYVYPRANSAEAVINELIEQVNTFSRVRGMDFKYTPIPR